MKTFDVRDGREVSDQKTKYIYDGTDDYIFNRESVITHFDEAYGKEYYLCHAKISKYLCRAILHAARDAGYEFKPEDVFYEVGGGYEQKDDRPPKPGDVVKLKEGETIDYEIGGELQGYAIWTGEKKPLCDPNYVVVGLGNDGIGHSFFVRKGQVEVVMRANDD